MPSNPPRRILRLHDVKTATGFGRSHIYNLMASGQFPKAHKIGTRAIGWDSREIEQWIDQRLGAANA